MQSTARHMRFIQELLSYGTFGLWGAFLANAQEILVSKKMMQTTKEGYELQQANLPNVIVI